MKILGLGYLESNKTFEKVWIVDYFKNDKFISLVLAIMYSGQWMFCSYLD